MLRARIHLNLEDRHDGLVQGPIGKPDAIRPISLRPDVKRERELHLPYEPEVGSHAFEAALQPIWSDYFISRTVYGRKRQAKVASNVLRILLLENAKGRNELLLLRVGQFLQESPPQ